MDKQPFRVPEEKHYDHHKYVDRLIEKEVKKDERREELRTKVFGWGVITLLGAIGTGAWNLFKYLFKGAI